MNKLEELAEPDIPLARRQMAHPCENIGEALKAARARARSQHDQ